MRRRIIVIVCLSLLAINGWVLVVHAAEGQAGQESAFLELGVGARPLAMGGSFVAISDDANAVYWNPAGLVHLKENEITSMQTELFLDTRFYYLSYGMLLEPGFGFGKDRQKHSSGQAEGGKWGCIGFSWMQLSTGNMPLTKGKVDEDGNPIIDPGTGKQEVEIIDYFDAVDNAYLLGYGRRIMDNLSIGINMKILTRKIGGWHGSGVGVDIGGMYEPTDKLTLGLVFQDIGKTNIHWNTGTNDRTPGNVKLGVGYKILSLKDYDLLLTYDISQKMKKKHVPIHHFGAEWTIAKLVALRLGCDDISFTCGAGFMMKIDSVSVRADYAYVTHAEFDNTHRISLSIGF